LEWWAAIDDGAPHRCPTNVHTTAMAHRKRPSHDEAKMYDRILIRIESSI
jgi:hypothetical protein